MPVRAKIKVGPSDPAGCEGGSREGGKRDVFPLHTGLGPAASSEGLEDRHGPETHTCTVPPHQPPHQCFPLNLALPPVSLWFPPPCPPTSPGGSPAPSGFHHFRSLASVKPHEVPPHPRAAWLLYPQPILTSKSAGFQIVSPIAPGSWLLPGLWGPPTATQAISIPALCPSPLSLPCTWQFQTIPPGPRAPKRPPLTPAAVLTARPPCLPTQMAVPVTHSARWLWAHPSLQLDCRMEECWDPGPVT